MWDSTTLVRDLEICQIGIVEANLVVAYSFRKYLLRTSRKEYDCFTHRKLIYTEDAMWSAVGLASFVQPVPQAPVHFMWAGIDHEAFTRCRYQDTRKINDVILR